MRLLRQVFVCTLLIFTASVSYAEINISASAIHWNASVPYDRLILTVGGPDGFTFSKEFAAGRIPTLSLTDLGAKIDGSYTWQLRFVPRIGDDVRQKLAAARAADDDAGIARIEASLDREKVESLVASRFEPDHSSPAARSLQQHGWSSPMVSNRRRMTWSLRTMRSSREACASASTAL